MDNLKDIIKDRERKRQEEIYDLITDLFGFCLIGALLWLISNCL